MFSSLTAAQCHSTFLPAVAPVFLLINVTVVGTESMLLVPNLQHRFVWFRREGKAFRSQCRREEMYHDLLQYRNTSWYWSRDCEELDADIRHGPGSGITGAYGHLSFQLFPGELVANHILNLLNWELNTRICSSYIMLFGGLARDKKRRYSYYRGAMTLLLKAEI